MTRSRLFGTLCGMVLLVNLGRLVFAPLVAEFIDAFGMGEGLAGLIVTLVWVGSALPRVPAGWLMTRVPRHWLVLGAGVVQTAAAGFIAVADSIPLLAAGALGMGLASGVYFVAANPLVSELYPVRVGRAIGVHGGASQLAAVVAAPFVTLALVVGPWRLVFVCIGVAAALVTVALVLVARGTDLPSAGRNDRDMVAAVRAEWRLILLGIVILGFTGFVWQGVFNFYDLYMRSKGLPAATARNMLTVIFAAGLPAFVVSGRLADRLPTRPYVLGIVFAFAAGVLALTVTHGLLPLLVLSAVVGYVIHSLFPALDTFLLGTLPDEHRASAYSVFSFGMMVGQAGGASTVGALVETGFGYDAVFGGLALGLVGVAAVLAVLWRAGQLPG